MCNHQQSNAYVYNQPGPLSGPNKSIVQIYDSKKRPKQVDELNLPTEPLDGENIVATVPGLAPSDGADSSASTPNTGGVVV